MVSSREQYAQLTELRAVDPRIAAVYRECEDVTLHKLDLAFVSFFRARAKGIKRRFPRFKAGSRWSQIAFSHGNRAIRLDDAQKRLQVPGIGWMRIRRGRLIPSAFGRAFIQERQGRWYAIFECERNVKPLPPTSILIGIDRGIHSVLALSDGLRIPNLAVGEKRRAATASLQRQLEAATVRDRKSRVINRNDPDRLAAARRLSRARERQRNARRDYLHKLSRKIIDGADVLCLERLDLRSMTRSAKGTLTSPGRSVSAKSVLNRKILDTGFGLLRNMIVSKAEEAARTIIEVSARYSSQTCSACGLVDSKSRRGRLFRCVRCGHLGHADVEAAREIRRRAESQLMRDDAGAEPACIARLVQMSPTTRCLSSMKPAS